MPENRRGTQSFPHPQHATTLSKNILTISNWLISRRRSRRRRYRLVIASKYPCPSRIIQSIDRRKLLSIRILATCSKAILRAFLEHLVSSLKEFALLCSLRYLAYIRDHKLK
jgi:hypothetical protein